MRKDQLPRAKWKLCRVEELIQGRDGHVRAVKVTLGDGHIYKRPIQHLYPLEVQGQIAYQEESTDQSSPLQNRKYPARSAAINALDKIQMLKLNSGGKDVRKRPNRVIQI